jgi:hypothetical protein
MNMGVPPALSCRSTLPMAEFSTGKYICLQNRILRSVFIELNITFIQIQFNCNRIRQRFGEARRRYFSAQVT